jgi:SOS-response transcriptional repressor LexA
MTPPPLTRIQRHALKLIEQFIARHGYPPSTRELARLRRSGQTAAHEVMRQLKAKGYVTWEPRTVGTLRVLKPRRRSYD